jgi:hypothetical protein
MSELDEKVERTFASPTDELDLALDPSKEFALIHLKENSRSNSHTRNHARSLRSISRTRSNNGYGCDGNEDSMQEDGGDAEAGGAHAEKDPFEVHWEGGDSDPLNPRSMTMARKWIVVIVVSTSSLCV